MNDRQKRLLFWLIVSLIVSVLVFLVVKTYPFYKEIIVFTFKILTPFVIAAFFAYLLHPLVEWLHKHMMPRWAAILLIYFGVFGGAMYGLYKAYPVFVQQLKELTKNIPALMETFQGWIYNLYLSTSDLPEEFHDRLDEIFLQMEDFIASLLTNVISSLTGITDVFIILAVIPVIVFYVLKDYYRFKSAIVMVIPERNKERLQTYANDLNKSLGGYLRGQLLVCLFVGVISSLLLWAIRMKYPLLLGTFMGVTNIIPYFGPVLGAVPAVIIAFTISVQKVLYVVIVVFVVQLIESNLLSPYIVGRSLHVHPIFIILALLIGGEAFGIIGMILAVPLLTIGKVFMDHTLMMTRMKEGWKNGEK
ncbi:AI-2E family transporter [Salirhabdus salicampi]|uniref:AI-2E family transporter n=1 Tax=Salirhabdus salicampi TaxID=476102 RepID=UPI0020C572D6|nr:AI-2E family transporter [Salirhabdus salicampi]MCP8616962.1 AI-2E family transporter [Salirhabdus salicampi]